MRIAFLIQNLAHKSDSVGFDCIFQHHYFTSLSNVRHEVHVFADVFDERLHPDVKIQPFSEFWSFYDDNPDTLLIYHFCDGWEIVDKFIVQESPNCVIRWHNNTPPWFYTEYNLDFAFGCWRGFQVVSHLIRNSKVQFWVNSEFSRRQLKILGAPASRISTVFPGSNLLYRQIDTLAHEGDDRADGDIHLLFVGRVAPHKGHKHVINVAALVQSFTGRNVEVQFVGSIEGRLQQYADEVANLAHDRGLTVKYSGIVSDEELKLIYKRADVFICLSEHEGFGLPVFEAMSLGVPVVAWSNSAMADLLDGHPLACANFDLGRFAASVVAALTHEHRTDVLKAQDDILNNYSASFIYEQLNYGIARLTKGALTSCACPPLSTLNDKFDHIKSQRDEIYSLIGDSSWLIDDHIIFDAPLNYVSLYDISNYGRLIGALRQQNQHVNITANVLELHPKHEIITAISHNNTDIQLSEGDLISQILLLNDDVFVKVAFLTLFGREADESAIIHYVRLLRAGHSKVDILRDLVKSPEFSGDKRWRDTLLTGAPKLNDNSTSLFGSLLSLFRGSVSVVQNDYERDRTGLESLQRIDDAVGRLGRYLLPQLGQAPPYHPLGSISHISQLMALSDSAFVDWSYRSILGRQGDPQGLDYWKQALTAGFERREMLRVMCSAPEAQSRIHIITGLTQFIENGLLVDDQCSDAQLTQRLTARIENEIGRVIQLLLAHGLSNSSLNSTITNDIKFPIRSSDLNAGAVMCKNPPGSSDLVLLDNSPTVIQMIHHVLINASDDIPEQLPLVVRQNINSVKMLHPSASHALWSGKEIRKFIASHFSIDVLSAYDALEPYAYKADLARYCLLYVYGGLYTDLSNRFMSPLRIAEHKRLAFFQEHKPLHGAFWMVQNTIIYSRPRQPEIALAIELIVSNVQSRRYGISSLAPSGPVLFGQALAAIGRAMDYGAGWSLNPPFSGGGNRSCYIDEEGKLIAIRLQAGGGKPVELGLRGTNVYGEMWDAGVIYGEGRLKFRHDATEIRHLGIADEDGILFEQGPTGIILYGPYASVPAGHYVAKIEFERSGLTGALTIDICAEGAQKHIMSAVDVQLPAHGVIDINFSLDSKVDDLEVRLHSNGNFGGKFLRLSINTVEAARWITPASQSELSESAIPKLIAETDMVHIIQIDKEIHEDLAARDCHEAENHVRELVSYDSVKVWHINEVRALVHKSFGSLISEAYENIQNDEVRVAFGSLCLLHRYGGWYVDKSVRVVDLAKPNGEHAIICFRTSRPVNGATWAIDPAFIYAKPSSSEIYEALEELAVSLKLNRHVPSVDAVLGRVLATRGRAEAYSGGEVISINRSGDNPSSVYLGFDGRIMAVR